MLAAYSVTFQYMCAMYIDLFHALTLQLDLGVPFFFLLTKYIQVYCELQAIKTYRILNTKPYVFILFKFYAHVFTSSQGP